MPSRVILLILLFLFGSDVHAQDNLSKWKQIGPNGGRLDSLAFDRSNPSAIWADGYRSMNRGDSWKQMPQAGAPRVDPFQTNHLVVMTPADLRESFDGGTTWQKLSDYPGGFFNDFQFNPAKQRALYAYSIFNSDQFSFYASSDGGKTWNRQTSLLDGNYSGFGKLVIYPTKATVLYTILSSREGKSVVFQSKDGGKTWVSRNHGLSCCSKDTQTLAIDPKHPRTLYAGGPQGIFKTTDGGINWLSTHCGCGAQSIAIDPFQSKRIFAVASSRFAGDPRTSSIFSEDSGQTWKQLSLPQSETWSFHEIATHPSVPNLVYAASSYWAYRSTDGGKTWLKLAMKGVNRLMVSSLIPDPLHEGHLYILASGLLLETNNFGKTWNTVDSISQLSVGQLAIHPRDPGVIVASVHSGFAISEDAGSTWRFRKLKLWVLGIVFDPVDKHTFYFWAFNRKGVAKSTNLGNTWVWIDAGFTDPYVSEFSIHPRAKVSYSIYGSGNVYRTQKNQSYWTNVGTLSPLAIVALQLDPVKENTAYLITVFNDVTSSTDDLVKTEDGGGTWRKILPLAFRYSINPLQHDQMIAVSDGFKITNDGGKSWSDFPADGPVTKYTYVNSMVIAPWPSNPVLIGGTGIYARRID